MLTRGHLIGQIIDDLALIAAQAKQRANMQLFDIHIYVEEFAKEVLNRTLDLSLSNLNTERSNNPGLDLGDEVRGWAFQVTTDKSSAKVKKTLEKLSAEQRGKYPNIRIFVLGEKQGTYKFKGEPYESLGFKPEMVLDINDICRKIMSLEFHKLKDLAEYISAETRRVQIELAIPNKEDQFAGSIDHLLEAIPRPQVSDAAKMEAYFQAKYGEGVGQREAKEAITRLTEILARLPRRTREVFTALVQQRDKPELNYSEDFTISEPKLRRIYRGDDLDGDLALLMESGLLSYDGSLFIRDIEYYQIHLPGSGHGFDIMFVDYVANLNLDLHKPLVMLDFSDF